MVYLVNEPPPPYFLSCLVFPGPLIDAKKGNVHQGLVEGGLMSLDLFTETMLRNNAPLSFSL